MQLFSADATISFADKKLKKPSSKVAHKNICSKIWIVDQLYIKLGYELPLPPDFQILWQPCMVSYNDKTWVENCPKKWHVILCVLIGCPAGHMGSIPWSFFQDFIHKTSEIWFNISIMTSWLKTSQQLLPYQCSIWIWIYFNLEGKYPSWFLDK